MSMIMPPHHGAHEQPLRVNPKQDSPNLFSQLGKEWVGFSSQTGSKCPFCGQAIIMFSPAGDFLSVVWLNLVLESNIPKHKKAVI